MGRNNNLRAESTFCRSYLLSIIKKSIKFVVSFSLLSFLVSYFSLITLFLRSSFFSSLTSPIFIHIWDKNYMFLLCNGILVILGSHSGLFGGSSSDVAGQYLVTNVSIQPPEKVETKPESEPEPEVVAVADQEVAIIYGGEEVIDNGSSITEGDDRDNGFLIVSYEDQIEEQEEEEEETELMSAEELNKKCDEFIKKMKQGIKWESQKLVMVQ